MKTVHNESMQISKELAEELSVAMCYMKLDSIKSILANHGKSEEEIEKFLRTPVCELYEIFKSANASNCTEQ